MMIAELLRLHDSMGYKSVVLEFINRWLWKEKLCTLFCPNLSLTSLLIQQWGKVNLTKSNSFFAFCVNKVLQRIIMILFSSDRLVIPTKTVEQNIIF